MGSSYRATLSLTTALDRVGVQSHVPADLPLEITRLMLYRKLGRAQGMSGLVRKFSPQLGYDIRTVQSVASRYTD